MNSSSNFVGLRVRRLIADFGAVLGIVGFAVLGAAVHSAIMALQVVGARLTDAGSGFTSTMSEISVRLGEVPVIGSSIRGPFDEASSAGMTLQEVGAAQQRAIEQLAVATGLAVAVLPITAILLVWLIPRIRFARESAWVRAASTSPGGLDLLACRALVSRRIPEILAAHPDAAAGWRRNDRDAVLALALLELRAFGVRPARTAVLRRE